MQAAKSLMKNRSYMRIQRSILSRAYVLFLVFIFAISCTSSEARTQKPKPKKPVTKKAQPARDPAREPAPSESGRETLERARASASQPERISLLERLIKGAGDAAVE